MEEKLPTLITATLSPTTLHCPADYTELRDGYVLEGRSSGRAGAHNSTDFSLIVPHLVRTCPGEERGCQQDLTPTQQHSNLQTFAELSCRHAASARA